MHPLADCKIVSLIQTVIFPLFESLPHSTATLHNFNIGFQFAFNNLGKISQLHFRLSLPRVYALKRSTEPHFPMPKITTKYVEL